MARLGEIPYVIRNVGPFAFVKRIYKEIGDDGVFNMAAAVAFYWLLAIFPLIIFIVSLASLIPEGNLTETTKDKVTVWLYSNLAKEAADTVYLGLDEFFKKPRAGVLTVGLLVTLWAASNGMNATMTALDRCYNVTKPRPFFVQRGVAIGITLASVLIALAVIILLPLTSIFIHYLKKSNDYVPILDKGITENLINIGRYSVGVLLVILLVSSVYQFGVSIRRRWTLITPGAVFAVFGVMAMAYGFNWYVQHFGAASYNKTYGALGGVVILLFLFYLYAVVFLIGAEINSEIDFAVIQGRERDAADLPLSAADEREFQRFRRQLDARGAKFVEIRGKRAKEVETGEPADS